MTSQDDLVPSTAIEVRRRAFDWPDDLPALPQSDDPAGSCELVALSFSLPYLEPYLIRTMRVAAKEVSDPALRADMKAFSGQEAQHFQNHARVNDVVRAQLSGPAAAAMRRLEDRLDADYRRFSAKRSLAFNLVYAEGFEAMTFALARSLLADPVVASMDSRWRELVVWHLSEEIEHRSVTFDAYAHVVGKYPHRLVVGTWSQLHFASYLARMATVLQRDLVDPGASVVSVSRSSLRRQWKLGTIGGTLRAMSPRYNPADVVLAPELVRAAAEAGVALV